jgi:hypothetical protein
MDSHVATQVTTLLQGFGLSSLLDSIAAPVGKTGLWRSMLDAKSFQSKG